MPTITVQSIVLDGYIGSNNVQSFDGTFMEVGKQPLDTTFRGLMKFDLSSIPHGAAISQADLIVYMERVYSENNYPVTVHEVTAPWSSLTVWGTQPSHNTTVAGSDSAFGTAFKTFKVAPLLEEWVKGSKVNNGFMFKGNENSSESNKTFSTSESLTVERRPKLIVTYIAPPTVTSPNGGESINESHEISWSVPVGSEGDALTYQIGLSTDNGSTWKSIATEISGNSYIYDFSNEVESSQALIRIRAINAGIFGGYGYSEGVFTIQHNTSPTIPTNLTPSGVTIDRLKTRQLSWQHNDSPNDVQSKAEIEWRHQGEGLWNTITSNGPDTEYFLHPLTFSNGQIEWRVKTYDVAGLESPWSNVAVFTASEPTNAPTIVLPTSPVNVSRPVISWTSASQSSYQVLIENSLGTVVWDTGEITSEVRARTAGIDLINGGTYKIKVRVKDGSGLFSSFTEKTIAVSYTTPAKPIGRTEVNTSQNGIEILFTNPIVQGAPSVIRNEVYKRVNDAWLLIARGDIDSYTDFAVASGVEYAYKVRAIASNNTYSETETLWGEVILLSPFLSSTSDHYTWVDLKHVTATEKQRSRNRSLNQFVGREYPLAEFGGAKAMQLACEWISMDKDEVNRFYALIDREETLLYRDQQGRKEYLTVDVTSETESHAGALFRISFTADKVWFKEGII